MTTIRRAFPFAAALALVAVSCGGSSDEASDDAEAAPTTVEQAEEAGDDFTEAEEPTEEAPVTEEPSVTEEAPVTEEPEPATTEVAQADGVGDEGPAPTDPEPAAEEPAPDASAAASVEVSMVEWMMDAPTEYAAGDVTFSATNSGSFPHEFVVIAGEGYEALPLAEGGAVIEDDLPTGALLGRTGRLGGGSSEDLTVTLSPGNYVLLCNLGSGANSHAGQGQRLDIVVN